MADHMRRNDKLQALASDASRARTRAQARNAGNGGGDGGSQGAESQGGASRRAFNTEDVSRNRSSRGGEGASQNQASRQRADRMTSRRSDRTAASGHGAARATGRSSSRGGGSAQVQSMTLLDFVKSNAVGILSVAAVVAIVVIMIGFIRACSPVAHEEQVEQTPEAYVSPYDWTKLDRTDGRFAYVVDGKAKSRLGIDVSESQLEIDWNAVASDDIDFAMIRLGYRGATEGDLYYDAQFDANFKGAREAGLDCGVYFFSQAVNESEAIEEADFVLNALGGAALEYPIAFDSEVVASLGAVRTEGLSNDEMTAIALAFCNRVEQAGYRSYIYGNAGDLSRYDRSALESHSVWWAEYGSPIPNAQIDIAMWQYSNAGAVNGIQTQVDMDIDLSGALS